ncbi:MAG: cell division protein FtsA [marine bacterium B5-7]|nr:MAG: cell division protein FtsA [marine bacterium B5-7]
MAKKQERQFVVGLDIGTSKVVAIIGEINAHDQIEIIGVGSHASEGLKRGVVVNIESTVNSISSAVEQAEMMAGCEVKSVYTGIAGSHIKSFNSHGIVAIKEHEVTQADIDRVIDAAKAVAVPADQRILHILPQEFIIDNQSGIRDPIGMSGVRLEAKVHMVTGAVSAAQNIVNCVQRRGLDVLDIILQPLASSHAVLNEDEKELGVCLVDIGGGTTDIAVFTQGAIRHSAVVPIAGDQATNDIAVALRTPVHAAELVKRQFACLKPALTNGDAHIEIPGFSDRPGQQIAKKYVSEVITARYEELFELIQQRLVKEGFADQLSAGIVLTGGGASVPGALALAESVFKMPVRLGEPKSVEGAPEVITNPALATGIGLLLYAKQQQDMGGVRLSSSKSGLFSKMRQWFQTSW